MYSKKNELTVNDILLLFLVQKKLAHDFSYGKKKRSPGLNRSLLLIRERN